MEIKEEAKDAWDKWERGHELSELMGHSKIDKKKKRERVHGYVSIN